MTWTTPNTVAVGDVASASNHNTYIRDNLNYLYASRVKLQYQRTAGNYTTTSATNADIDGTNMTLTFTPVSTKYQVMLAGEISNNGAGQTVTMILSVAGTDYEFNVSAVTANLHYSFCAAMNLTLSVASQTIKTRWKTSGGTATLYGSGVNSCTFAITEMG